MLKKDAIAMSVPLARPSRHRGHPRPARTANRGVVLIEVMVAVLIFMLGILGFIGMQTALTRATTEADQRANAAYLANDVMGRMWGDISNLASYNGTSCTNTGCAEWREKVQQLLPGGTATITVDSTTNNVTVRIDWTLPGGSTHFYETQSNISAKAA
jgi:type IV pilus assembly protein PilV